MVSGRLFHKEGPMYDKVFCAVLILQKGCLSFAKLFLMSILLYGASLEISCRWKGQFSLKKLKVIAFMHWWTFSLVGKQLINLNSVRNMCVILSNLRQNRIHLFFIICIFFFVFSVAFRYQAVHALSKCCLISALQSFLLSSGVKIEFFHRKILVSRLFC